MHSPANFWITDSLGRSAGFQQDSNLIPDAFYDQEVKTLILLNPSDNLQLSVLGDQNIPANSHYELSLLEVTNNSPTHSYNYYDQINSGQQKSMNLDLLKTVYIQPDNNISLLDSFRQKIIRLKTEANEELGFTPAYKSLLNYCFDKALIKITTFESLYSSQSYPSALIQLDEVYNHLFRSRMIFNILSETPELKSQALSFNYRIVDAFSELNYYYPLTQEQIGANYTSAYTDYRLAGTLDLKNTVNLDMQTKQDNQQYIAYFQPLSFQQAEEYIINSQQSKYNQKYYDSLLYSLLAKRFLQEVN